MSTDDLLAVAVSTAGWGDAPLLAAVAGVIVVLALIAAGVALVVLRVRRSLQAQLANERERHDALRRQVAALEVLDLAARRLTAAQNPAAIADEVARAADELVGATEAVLLLRAADDLTVTVRGSRDEQRSPAASASAQAQALAIQAVARRGPVRSASDGAGGGEGDEVDDGVPAAHRVPRLALPLRRADECTGVLVLARGEGEAPFSPAETTLVERLAAHVALAVAPHAPSAEATAVAGVTPAAGITPAAGATPASPTPASASVVDLVAVVRELTAYARTLAEAQGERRRVAVLAPVRARSELPEETVRELIRRTYEFVIGGTEPGSNIAVEILALEDGWELVVAHGGDALSTRSPAASSFVSLVAALDGEVESGQGAGVARIRIRLPHARTQDRRPSGDAGRSLAAR